MNEGPVGKTARFIYISDGDKESAWRTGNRAPRRVGWRLIAANNRALGRSWVAFDSFEACVQAASLLRERLDEVTSSVTFDSRQANWSWTVLLDDDPVAVCVRAYRRRVECLRALEQFLAAVKMTTNSAEELRYYGRNALSVYDPPPGGIASTDLVASTPPTLAVAAHKSLPATT